MDKILANNGQLDPFTIVPTITEYDKFNWLPLVTVDQITTTRGWFWNVFDYLSCINSKDYSMYASEYINPRVTDSTSEIGLTYDSYKYYPRRMGFYPKKIAM